jgi:large subunit ribosomal protein L25
MARRELSVETRQVLGKKVAQLRRTGFLPANVYGHGVESVAVQVETDSMEKTLKASSANEVIDLKIAGESQTRPVVIQRIQRHPLTSRTLHLEFYQVSLRQKMRADVPLVIVGQSHAIDTFNGVLVTAIESVQVEALPLDLPSRIEVDIRPLRELEQTLHVRDLPIPESVVILTDPDVVVVKVASPRVSVEGEEAPEAAEAEEEAAAATEDEEAAESTEGEPSEENA